MGEDGKLGWKIKAQISRFANRLSERWPKTKRRLAAEMLYGIQASKDVKVSEIARSLNEPIALIQTEKRLCRNLSREDLTERINRRLSFEGARAVEPDSVLAVDLSDVSKPYAKKMEHLATVRDGSTGDLGPGYWLCEVIAAHPLGQRIVPLYGELYSQKAEDFRSENDVILGAVACVAKATERRGIFTIDRGGDRRKLLIPFLDNRAPHKNLCALSGRERQQQPTNGSAFVAFPDFRWGDVHQPAVANQSLLDDSALPR